MTIAGPTRIGIVTLSLLACASRPAGLWTDGYGRAHVDQPEPGIIVGKHCHGGGSLRARIEACSPDARWAWDSAQTVNLDGDGKPDLVVLGATANAAVVDLVLGADPTVHEMRIVQGRGQADNCAPPSALWIRAEECSADGEFSCRPAPGRAPVTALEAVRLDSGLCDAFHFYFDGEQVNWWRA